MEARLGDGELGTLEVLVGHIVASRSVTNADAEGAELFERVVGSRECPTGLGIALLVTEAQVHTVMDEQRFWNNAREAYGLLAPGMSKVTSSEAWLSDMLGLAEELHEAAMQIQLNVPRLDRPDVLARTFVRTGHVLTERVAKYLLATLLAANRDKSYAELRTRDFGDLLQQCRDLGWAGLTEGIDKALRHADAHKLFIVATDGVRFTAERREYDWLSGHELIDRVLLCYESVLALDTAVLCTFVASGGEVESIDPLRNLPMDAFDKTRVAMRLCGLAVTDLNYPDESTLHIHADASFAATSSQSGFLAGGLYYLLRRADGPVPDCIEIVVNAPGGPVVWRGPTAPLSAHAQALSDSDRTASMIESGIVWTRDGEPLLPHGAGRQGAARALVEAPVNDLPAATRHMRPWLSLAVRLNDRELTSLLRTLLRTWRRRSMSQPADPEYVDAFTALLSWRDLVADADDAPRAA